MRKKSAEKTRRVLTLLLAFVMLFTVALPAFAEDDADGESGTALSASEDPRDSVLMISVGYEDDGGNYTAIAAGTCFLINDEYVITNYHVVAINETVAAVLAEAFGVRDLTDSHIKWKLHVNRDMTIDASVHENAYSQDMDFALVKLSDKIYDRSPIALGDSDTVEARDTVYALGYPADSIQNKEYNTTSDVSTTNGTVSKISDVNGVDYIEHTATLNDGNSGGPLLNENNEVIGVNTAGSDTKFYSLPINDVKGILNSFGISYVDSAEEPADTVTREELLEAINEMKAVDTSDYTDASVEAFESSIDEAQAVYDSGTEDETELQTAIDAMEAARSALEKKPDPIPDERTETNWLLIGCIAGAAVLIILIIIIIAVSSSKKKKAKKLPPNGQYTNIPPSAGTTGTAQGGMRPGAYTTPPTPAFGGTGAQNTGAGETSLLTNDGAGETTLLSGGTAYLIRRKNGERIAINRPNFKIGKERARVDYCVADNPTVSRTHCEIRKKGTDYYVTDLRSANSSYVNGVQLASGVEKLLTDRSVLKLSDEEFEFHLS